MPDRGAGTARCTQRKHVVERGQPWCDCRGVLVGPTAAKNALVVTIIDPLQATTLAKISEATDA